MKVKTFVLTILAAMSLPSLSWAHGDDQPGPHGGSVQMPGAFHTELVADADRLRVYLLDIQFKNPVTANSQVDVRIKQSGKQFPLTCTPEVNYFTCELPGGINLDQGSIAVSATRVEQEGVEVEYPLPLKFSKADHSTH